ncbi:hypothetical protein [Breznakibacter xylanolyticus]|uniref:hypothetical protein n=1 Tax=Breznakibacter xylanolyticus TaxID=990 RepID=UPI0014763846|nr:hypothetical protein [Breznakibacter xylanolyticus]
MEKASRNVTTAKVQENKNAPYVVAPGKDRNVTHATALEQKNVLCVEVTEKPVMETTHTDAPRVREEG